MTDYIAWSKLLLAAIVGSLVVFLFYYRWRYGPRLAAALTIRGLVLVIAFFAIAVLLDIALSLQSDLLLYIAGGASILVPLLFLIRLIVLQPKADAILLDLEDADDANLGLAFFVGVFLIGNFLFKNLTSYSSDPAKLIFMLLTVLSLILVFIWGLGRRVRSTCLTAEALYLRDNRIKWADVKEHRWERLPSGKEVLLICAQGYLPFFNQFIVRVPFLYKEALSDNLERFTPQTAG